MFASLFSVKSLAPAARKGSPRRARPEIDALEDRTVPSTLFAGEALQNDGAVAFPGRPGEEIPTATATYTPRAGEEIPTATAGSGLHSSRSKGEEIPSGSRTMGEEIPVVTGGKGGIIGDCGFTANVNPFRKVGEEIPSGGSAGEEIPMLTGGKPSISGDCPFGAPAAGDSAFASSAFASSAFAASAFAAASAAVFAGSDA